jgi:RNA ligase
MADIIDIARQGPGVNWSDYGHVRAVYSDDLVLLNYTQDAEYKDEWGYLERVSRGLIINWKMGYVAARPFDKFWNWGQRGRYSSGHLVTITEKMDGSLGILYRKFNDGKISYHIATRGSFDSKQAIWATRFLNDNHCTHRIPLDYTLLFEIIYPGNRVVVDYGNQKKLVLLAMRNRHTGEFAPHWPHLYEFAQFNGFSVPQTFAFNSVTAIMESTDYLDANHEGYVALFNDGQRFKFKGDRYVELHRIITNLSFKRVLDAVKDGTYNQVLNTLPDEFLPQVFAWRNEIDEKVISITEEVESAFEDAPKDNRKEFALWVNAWCKDIAAYMFLKLDGKDYVPTILEREF